MTRIALTLILVLSACAGYAQTDMRTHVLDTKPGLDKPITLSMRAASLKEVLEKIGAETGVKLRPMREVAADKATIWVRDKPARDVLRAIARCFNLGWSEEEVGSIQYLNLYMDRASVNDMRQRQYDDYLVLLTQYDKEMQTLADIISSGQKYEAKQIDQSRPQGGDLMAREYMRQYMTQSPPMEATILQFLKLSKSQKQELFEGKDVSVSGEAIDPDAKAKYPQVTAITYWVERSLGGYMLNISVQPMMGTNTWSWLCAGLFDDSRYDKVIETANAALAKDAALSKDIPAPKPTEPPPAAQNPAASVPAPAASSPPAVNPVPRPGEGSGATPTTMTDGLLQIAEVTGIPVVAQYLSEYAPPAAAPAGKAADRIAALSRLHTFVVEKDGDFLCAKSLLWHRLRDREVPEETIRRWQRVIAGLPYPTFDVTVEMGSMSWGQVRGIINNAKYWFGLSDLSNLAYSEYVFKLYSSLKPSRQQMLGEGVDIPVSALQPDQESIFMQAYERRSRPTYAKAQGPSWRQTAAFSMKPPSPGAGPYSGLGSLTLYAIADMRCLGTQGLVDSTASANGTQPNTVYTIDTLHSMQQEMEVAKRKAEEAVGQKSSELLARVSGEHPEIPRRNIAIYAAYQVRFTLRIGTDTRTAEVTYCAKAL